MIGWAYCADPFGFERSPFACVLSNRAQLLWLCKALVVPVVLFFHVKVFITILARRSRHRSGTIVIVLAWLTRRLCAARGLSMSGGGLKRSQT